MHERLLGSVVVVFFDSALRLFLFLTLVRVNHLQEVVDCFFNHDILAFEVGSFVLDFGSLHLYEFFQLDGFPFGLGEDDEHFLRDCFDVLLDSRFDQVVRVVDEFGEFDEVLLDLLNEALDFE